MEAAVVDCSEPFARFLWDPMRRCRLVLTQPHGTAQSIRPTLIQCSHSLPTVSCSGIRFITHRAWTSQQPFLLAIKLERHLAEAHHPSHCSTTSSTATLDYIFHSQSSAASSGTAFNCFCRTQLNLL